MGAEHRQRPSGLQVELLGAGGGEWTSAEGSWLMLAQTTKMQAESFRRLLKGTMG